MLSDVGLISPKIIIQKGCESINIPIYKLKNDESFSELSSKFMDPKYNQYCTEENNEINNNLYDIDLYKLKTGKNYYAIRIHVKNIKYPDVKVAVIPMKAIYTNGNDFEFNQDSIEPLSFNVSYFDMPYMDNTKIFENKRFSIILKAVCTKETIKYEEDCPFKTIKKHCSKNDNSCIENEYAIFQVVTFKEEIMTLRDRPLFEEMLRQITK